MKVRASLPGRGRVLRWVPVVVLGGIQAWAWGAMFRGGMAGVMGWVVLLSIVPYLGLVGFAITGLYAAWRRRRSAPVIATLLASVFALWPGAWLLGMAQIAYPASLATSRPEARVRLPSDRPLKVLWGGDELGTNQHAFTPDQRWAYDLLIEPYLSGSSDLTAYGCWGTPVLSVAHARVAAAHDGEPDVQPGQPPSAERPLGNYVALELESKTFVVIAHLQSGSVRVREGDTVGAGQLLGRCGNSGHTSEPHIHIHHQRQHPKDRPVNFAEGLPLYFRDHTGPEMPRGGVSIEGDRATATGDVVVSAKTSR